MTLNHAGFFQTLRHGSEGGIDVSNLPYAYSCIPFIDPESIAVNLKKYIKNVLDKNVDVMISDSDKTYSFFNFHFSPRKSSLNKIHCFSVFSFITWPQFSDRSP